MTTVAKTTIANHTLDTRSINFIKLVIGSSHYRYCPLPRLDTNISYTLTETLAAVNFKVFVYKLADGSLISSDTVIGGSHNIFSTANTTCFITAIPEQGTRWQAGTLYSLNDLVMPIAPSTTPYYFKRVSSGGTSGSTEPIWNTTVGGTCDDVLTNCWQMVGRLTQPITHLPIVSI